LLLFEKKSALLVTLLASSRPTFVNRYNETADYLHCKGIKKQQNMQLSFEATEAGVVWGNAMAELITDLYQNFEFVVNFMPKWS